MADQKKPYRQMSASELDEASQACLTHLARVEGHKADLAKRKQELAITLRREWDHLTPELCQGLIDIMTKEQAS